MACEDYPCCGHELGCCPDYDESGRQINMRCTCGAVLPVNRSSSLCDACLRRGIAAEEGYDEYNDYGDDYESDRMLEEQEREDFCETDEAYGHYDDSDWF